MQYFQHLKFPFEVDLFAAAKFEVAQETFGYKVLDRESLGTDICNLLESHGLFILNVDTFHTPAVGVLRPHIDLDKVSNFCKIAFSYGAYGSRMYWYTLQEGFEVKLDESNRGYYAPTPGTKSSHIFLPRESCISAASARIGTPTLVNVGQPHGVINYSKESRWTICVTFTNAQGGLVEFDEAKEKLKDYVC